MGAVSPEEGPSYTKANGDGDDETRPEGPQTSRRGWSTSLALDTRRTYIIVSINTKLMWRGQSALHIATWDVVGKNKWQCHVRGRLWGVRCRVHYSRDIAATDILASATWALHGQCIRK